MQTFLGKTLAFGALGALFVAAAVAMSAQGDDGFRGGGGVPLLDHDDISPEQRALVERSVAAYEARQGGLAPAIAGPQAYPFYPQAGTLWRDLFVNNFVDLDPAGGIQDWDCTQFTYDGHRGHDSDIRSFREKSIGVPVFAALDGTVINSHDGEPDENTSGADVPANFVVIDHGGTHSSWYWHLKNGSVAVSNGQPVVAGQQIGLTASSGSSTWPHLHFESHYGGTWFEPSSGPCNPGQSNWVDQTPIHRDLYVRDVTVAPDFNGSNNTPWDQATRVGGFLTGFRSVALRIMLANQPANSTWRIRYQRPDATSALDQSGNFNNPYYRWSHWWWGYNLTLDVPGTWHILLDLNGQTIVDAPFKVAATAGEIFNRPPAPVTVGLSQSSPSTNDVVFCRVENSLVSEDPDYDVVRYLYEWKVNGSSVRSLTAAALSDAARKGLLPGGSSPTCSVTASDAAQPGVIIHNFFTIRPLVWRPLQRSCYISRPALRSLHSRHLPDPQADQPGACRTDHGQRAARGPRVRLAARARAGRRARGSLQYRGAAQRSHAYPDGRANRRRSPCPGVHRGAARVMDLLDKLRPIGDQLASLGHGATPFDTTIEETPTPCEATIDGRPVLMCGSNNYFGLSHHPDVIAAAAAALRAYGSGTTGSRAANGTLTLHGRLEREFAECYGKRHALVFTTGYQANLGLIAGLCGSGDTVLVDFESHASIYDGARLSGAQVFGFRHNSADDLRRKLSRLAEPRRALVVVEGLYSITGDLAPLGELAAACRDAGAYLMVDEAHAFGAYGDSGLGAAEAQGVLAGVDFIVGTFSKTLAGVGGFCVSDHAALRHLHFTARSYVFTASGSPANIAGVTAALAIVRRDRTLAARLWSNVRHMRAGLSRLGYQIGHERIAHRAHPHRRRRSHD